MVISVVNPLLFLAALGVGLGRLVDAHQSAHLSGVAYADFLARGCWPRPRCRTPSWRLPIRCTRRPAPGAPTRRRLRHR
ncbi:hypothetical protein ACFQ60_02155 [Streptomyces zhihengii]